MAATTISEKRRSYRPELDGLRGLAISLVVLFHIFVGRVSGGVDIFLLLAGYFFLGSQLRYASRDNASLNPFWPLWRTLRRLIPTMVVMLVAVVAASFTILPQWMRPDLAAQVTASMGYFQNWVLFLQGQDYNVASDQVSPLQHLWSMSVQGQFYLVGILFAILLAALCTKRRDLVQKIAGPILIAATIASFLYALSLADINQPLNYYSSLSRAWEITLGAALAIYAASLSLPRILRELMVTTGLVMVLVTGVLFDGAALFPGPAALFPIGGAVLIILGSNGSGAMDTVLTNAVMQWLGRIAYGFYVWHWPILIGATVLTEQENPSIPLGLAVLGVSLVAADLNFRLIESPLRQHRRRPTSGERPVAAGWDTLRTSPAAKGRAVGGAVMAVATVAMLVLSPALTTIREQLQNEELDPATYPGAAALAGVAPPPADPKPSPLVISEMYPVVGRDGCMNFHFHEPDLIVTNQHNDPELPECVYGDPDGDTVIYLLGGSHSEQWSTPLDTIGQREGIRIVPLLRQGCPFVLGPQTQEFTPECVAFNENILDYVIDNPPDAVFSTTTRPLNGYRGPDFVPPSYRDAWQALADNDIPFFGLRDNPWNFDPAGEMRDPIECVQEEEDDSLCDLPRHEVYSTPDPAQLVLNSYPNMVGVDTSDWFCTDDVCPTIVGNIFVYRDRNHLSEPYLQTLVDPLSEALTTFLDTIVRSPEGDELEAPEDPAAPAPPVVPEIPG